MRLRGITTLAFWVLAAADAQTIKEAQALSGGRTVQVSFDRSFTSAGDRSRATNAANYTLIDVSGVRRIKVDTAGLPDESVVELRLGPGEQLQPPNVYHLYAANLTFGDKPPGSGSLDARVKLAIEPGGPKPAPSGSGWSFEAADSKDDANIYIAGEMVRSSGGDPVGSADVKVSVPWRLSGYHRIAPSFTLMWSNAPDADPDTLSLAFEDSLNLGQKLGWKGWLRRTLWVNTPKIESDRSFENTNFIVQTKLLNAMQGHVGDRLYFTPLAGVEVGKNLRSPVKEAEGRGLARPLAGMRLTAPLAKFSAGALRKISLTASWERRWPLTREVYFKVGDNQAATPVRFGTNPKDYVTAKINFSFKNFFGFYAGYDYGSLPPKYKFVDSRVTLGVLYSVGISH